MTDSLADIARQQKEAWGRGESLEPFRESAQAISLEAVKIKAELEAAGADVVAPEVAPKNHFNAANPVGRALTSGRSFGIGHTLESIGTGLIGDTYMGGLNKGLLGSIRDGLTMTTKDDFMRPEQGTVSGLDAGGVEEFRIRQAARAEGQSKDPQERTVDLLGKILTLGQSISTQLSANPQLASTIERYSLLLGAD